MMREYYIRFKKKKKKDMAKPPTSEYKQEEQEDFCYVLVRRNSQPVLLDCGWFRVFCVKPPRDFT